MTDKITCGEALIRLLMDYDVDTVFGIPGVHTLDLYRGIANSNVRHVQAKNEQGAGFMADGYARVSGKPGVCTLITGPGVTNATTPMGQAFADSIPMLVITSENATHTLGKGWGCLHEITSQQAVTEPLTALSATALSPGEIPELIGQAFSIFSSGRRRPVHISIPTDVLAMPATGQWAQRQVPTRGTPDETAIDSAAELLCQAERPAILIGGGAIATDGSSIAELAAIIGAGIVPSNAGKGIVPDSHSLNLGTSMVKGPTQAFVADCDVVLALGTELSETDSYIKRLPINGKLIRIDIDAAKINDQYPADIGIVADASKSLEALLRVVRSRAVSPGNDATPRVAAANQCRLDELSPLEQQHQLLCGAIRAGLPEDAVIIGDMTQLSYTASWAMPVEQPGTWLHPAGFCTLGCAMPMAIGAKIASPHRAVIALVGDGGFMFTVGELAVAAELGQSLPIIVWNNGGYGQIRDGMTNRDIPAIGVNSPGPDFALLAKALGCEGVRPHTLDEVTEAIQRALKTPCPTLIEVRQDSPWLL
jgi:5-guanidino-2-oxopentanoate decarboxylase